MTTPPDTPLLVLSTCPDEAVAERLARWLVAERLAACVNILPGLRSVYEWQGRVEEEGEVLLIIKTSAARYAELESRLAGEHPYEVPAILAVELSAGLPPYLQWLAEAVRKPA